MKLITEQIESKFLVENVNGTKNYYIEGIFLQGDKPNKNRRVYPINVLQKAVGRYVTECVSQNRGYGELGHPADPTINLERVSHIIKELKQVGSDFVGKAKVLDTPYGRIVKDLINEGVSLGVSSRGVGSLEEKNGVNYVQDDYFIAAGADIVADPSAPDAYVRGILESKEWVYDNYGNLKLLEDHKNIIQNTKRNNFEVVFSKLFEDYLKNL